jgi:predicted TPR repeat methyltransferase
MATAGAPTAQALLKQGLYGAAAEACRRALAQDPGDVEAAQLLASVLIARGKPAFAIMTLEPLADSARARPSLYVVLGHAYRRLGETEHARRAIGRAVELDPAHAGARIELAYLHLETGDSASALLVLESLIESRPERPDAHFARATALLEAGELDQARVAFARAHELNPSAASWHRELATLHRALGDSGAAERALESGLLLQPDNPELKYLMLALTGKRAVARAPDDYLKYYFDNFAGSFDRVLRDDLEYRAPEALVDRVEPKLSARAGGLDILDVGCGTGLCGPLLRATARRLVGVDISPGMLARAAQQSVYDELVEAEITEFLRRTQSEFDLVIAADVLIYFGELSEVARLMVRALRVGGALAVSVERHGGGERLLQSSGRWAHSEGELRRVVEAAGCSVTIDEAVLRFENGEPVTGLLAVGVKQHERATGS